MAGAVQGSCAGNIQVIDISYLPLIDWQKFRKRLETMKRESDAAFSSGNLNPVGNNYKLIHCK